MTIVHRSRVSRFIAIVLTAVAVGSNNTTRAQQTAGCPKEGCRVTIAKISPDGTELGLTFEANFTPKMPGTHIHVWWAENFTIEQVGLNAQSAYGVPQGKWDYTDDYPYHSTHGPSSTLARGAARTLCVSAADNGHNIIDITKFYCVDVNEYLVKAR